MNQKLVSIITPCYNGERYIERLLASVLTQDHAPIEFIVIDDGSTDESLKILESYKLKFQKKHIKYHVISKKNGGAASAINKGLKKFSGEYVTFIDADDFLNEKSIKKRVEFLENNKKFDVVYSEANVVDDSDYGYVIEVLGEKQKPARTNLFADMLLENNYVWPPAPYFVRSSYFFSVHPTRHIEEFSIGQNIQLFLPLWHKGKVGFIKEPLVTVVSHDDSHSRKDRGAEENERQKQIEAAYLDTLERIDMPKEDKESYKSLIEERYRHVNERVFYDVQDGRDELKRLYDRDEERFRSAHFTEAETASQKQLASRLIFSSHSLEKSLSNDGFEIGHGFMVVRLLIGFLDIYKERQYDKNHLAYINTLSVLGAFYDRHKGTQYAQEIESIFGDWWPVIKKCKSTIGGAESIPIKGKQNNNKKNFKDLAEGRFAVRTYANKSVNKKDIEEAIEIALKTPTVCNRQPVRVRVMYDKSVIAKVLEVQGGLAHYTTPPVLLLITADDSSYVGINERNQGYIDGGLFAMSILYALEYKKLAASPLHAMFETGRDLTIRGLLNIPDNEKLITFISTGHFSEANNVCKSFRYPIDFIMTESDKIHNFRIETVVPPPPPQPEVQLSLADKVRIKLRLRTRARHSIAKVGAYLDNHKYKQADGAILTLTGYFNYGNVIQRYALQEFLRRNGHKFISYVDLHSTPHSMYRVGRKKKLKTPLRALRRFFRHQKPYWYIPKYSEIYPESHRWENIINFVNKNIWIKPFDPNDNYKNYIVGSDQVWRDWWNNREALGYYFFNFLKGRKANRIAYAASFGKDKIEEVMKPEDIEYIKPYIEEFDKISVREKSAINMIKKTWGLGGVDEVVDPTLLLNAADYSNLIDKSAVKYENIQPIFTYVLGETPEVKQFIRQIQDHRKQAVSSIRAHEGTENDILPPVEFWLKGFRDAELVVTNSFHGMMFSIINNTEFIIIGKEAGGLSRIKDFLSKYDLNDRFVDESELASFDVNKLKPIDWARANKKLKIFRKDSGDWLLDSLKQHPGE